MRIMWASHVIPYPPKSGVHLRSYHLLRAAGMHNDVDLLAFIQEPWLKIFYASREEALEDCTRHLRDICASVRFLPIDNLTRPFGKVRTAIEGVLSRQSYTVRWLQSRAARQAFADCARGAAYDLAHFDTISLAPFRPLFARTPATLGHHNVESHMLRRRSQSETDWLKRWYFLQESSSVGGYETRVAGNFAAHIACSELDCERLRALSAQIHAVAIPNGVDVEYFRPAGRAAQQHTLVFVGSLNWYPNVDAVSFLLREVWPLLKSRVPSVRLDVVGSAPPESILRLAASRADVKVHGFVDDVRPFMDAATLYVCPIRDGGGTKLKLLDAFAMAKCVVAHPIACEGIDVAAGRNVMLADSAAQFADCIQTLLENQILRERIGKAARELVVAHYSFAQIGRRLCEVFEAAAASGRQDLRPSSCGQLI
jgi:glycosyltransferase involved in cell wall biosynthesis